MVTQHGLNKKECYGTPFEEIIEDIERSGRYTILREHFEHFRSASLDVRKRMMTHIVSYVYGGVVTRRRLLSPMMMSVTRGKAVFVVTTGDLTLRDISSSQNHPFFLEVLDEGLKGGLDDDEKEIVTITKAQDKSSDVFVMDESQCENRRVKSQCIDDIPTGVTVLVILAIFMVMTMMKMESGC